MACISLSLSLDREQLRVLLDYWSAGAVHAVQTPETRRGEAGANEEESARFQDATWRAHASIWAAAVHTKIKP